MLSKNKNQSVLFQQTNKEPKFNSLRIENRGSFNRLLKKYNKSYRIISCWHSFEEVLRLFDFGAEFVEIVVGDSIVNSYKKQLSKKTEICEKLYELYVSGRFNILVAADKQIHSKFYIMENDNEILVSNGSMNFTKSGLRATHQKNYQWNFTFEKGCKSEKLNDLEKDYNWHKSLCRPFFGDLQDLIAESPDMEKSEIVEKWLSFNLISDDDELRLAFSEASKNILSNKHSSDEEVFFKIDESIPPKKIEKFEKLLEPVGGTRTEGGFILNPSGFLNHQTMKYPMMEVDLKNEMVTIGINNKRKVLVNDDYSLDKLESYLNHLEEYVETAKLSKNTNLKNAMRSIYEALLYMFSTPFFNEYHKKRFEVIGGSSNRTGPKILHLFGPSSNGKTHFFLFASKLITGDSIDPLHGDRFVRDKVEGYTSYMSLYPIIYDDLPSGKWRKGGPTDLIKNYWDTWFNPKFDHPQLVISSNDRCPNGPLKRRIMEIEFAMKFTDDPKNAQRFNELLKFENKIFNIFSKKYIKKLNNARLEHFSEPLSIARECFKDMYGEVGRELPEYFPSTPLKHYVDSGKQKWLDLVHRDGKARITKKKNIVQIHFDKEMARAEMKWGSVDEITNFINCLPNDMMTSRNGTLLTIESGEDFLEWFGPITRFGKFKRWWKGG